MYGVTADDSVRTNGIIASVIFQIAVHDDVDHSCGDVHDEGCHTNSDDIDEDQRFGYQAVELQSQGGAGTVEMQEQKQGTDAHG